MTTYLTPFNNGDAIDLGRLWRKQVLKFGKFRTNDGTELDINADLANDCIQAYRDGAFDQVPFQLVHGDNKHPETYKEDGRYSPENFRGEVKGFEVTPDGLDMIMEPSAKGEELLHENPRLGVSARIRPNYERRDGKTWRAAIEHIAGTLGPVVNGMRPWEAVNLSSTDDGDVIDLSDEEYVSMTETDTTTTEQAPVDEKTADELVEQAQLTETEIKAIADLLADDEEDTEQEENVTEEKPAAELVGADLSADAKAAIDLANKTAKEAQDRTAALEAQLAQERADREADAYLAAGVPPADIDLARPALALSGQVIDLSNGSKTDTGAIIRGLLNSRKGTIDLSGEKGHTDLSADEKSKHEALMSAWEKDFPQLAKK